MLVGFGAVWTAIVYPFSEYGDNWAVMPIFVIYPAIFLSFILNLFLRINNKLTYFFFSLFMMIMLFYPWIIALMLISKDSL